MKQILDKILYKILCFLGLHTWEIEHYWTPSIDAPVVTKYECVAECSICHKRKTYTWSKANEQSNPKGLWIWEEAGEE